MLKELARVARYNCDLPIPNPEGFTQRTHFVRLMSDSSAQSRYESTGPSGVKTTHWKQSSEEMPKGISVEKWAAIYLRSGYTCHVPEKDE